MLQVGDKLWEVRRIYNRFKRRFEILVHPVEVLNIADGAVRFLWNRNVERRCVMAEALRWKREDPRRINKPH